MDKNELTQKVNRFPHWYYEFDLEGVKTPLRHADSAVRHPQRKAYFFHPMLELLGGSLAGKRVLDLGCNQAYFSLSAIEHGCEFVLGLDALPRNIDQARLVFETKGVDRGRYELRCGDFFQALDAKVGKFDVVLALGIFHWLKYADHVRFLEAVSRVGTDLLLIDTVVSPGHGSAVELRDTALGERDPYRDGALRILPTRRGLLDAWRAFGYRGVILKPCFTDWTGSDDYRDGIRRAFLFAKRTALDGLSAPLEDAGCITSADALRDVSAKKLLQALLSKIARALRLRRH